MKRRQALRKALITVSFLLFPLTMYYFSPVHPIAGAAQGVVAGALLVFAILMLGAMVLGRAWCGWLCPGAGLTEACFMVNDNKAKGGRLNLIKWGLWFPWLAAIAFFAARAGGFSRIDFFFQTTHGVSVAQPGHYIVYYIFLGLIAALSLTAGRRAFCHYVCWMAPFMILGRQMGHTLALPALSLEADKSKCTACRSCDQSCPMSLNVLRMVQQGQLAQAECNLCAECADACPQEVISLGFSRPRPKSPTSARTP